MKRNRILALLLALALLLTASACKEKEPAKAPESSSAPEEIDPNWPVKVGELRIPERPERVVSLSPALTEVLCELGGESRLEGVSDYCDYPAGVEELTSCGSAQVLNREALETIKPQLVFASASLSQQDTVWLQQLGAEVLVLARAQSLEELEALYASVGMALDGMEDGAANGREVFGALRTRYEALTEAAGRVDKPLKGIYLRKAPLLMATGDTFEGLLLESIGIKNDAAQFTDWEYPAAEAANLYPDLIFYDTAIDPAYFAGTQVYSTTDAFKQKRLFPVEGIALERQSARLFDALEKMFRDAYPEVALSAPGEDAASTASDDGMLNLDDATKVE